MKKLKHKKITKNQSKMAFTLQQRLKFYTKLVSDGTKVTYAKTSILEEQRKIRYLKETKSSKVFLMFKL